MKNNLLERMKETEEEDTKGCFTMVLFMMTILLMLMMLGYCAVKYYF